LAAAGIHTEVVLETEVLVRKRREVLDHPAGTGLLNLAIAFAPKAWNLIRRFAFH
jgi:hypothetical protein